MAFKDLTAFEDLCICIEYDPIIPYKYIEENRSVLSNAFGVIFSEFANSVEVCLPVWNKAFLGEHEKLEGQEYHEFLMQRCIEVVESLQRNPIVKMMMPDDSWYLNLDEAGSLHYGMKYKEHDAIDVSLCTEVGNGT